MPPPTTLDFWDFLSTGEIFDWGAISLNIFVGVIGFVLLIVGGIAITRGTPTGLFSGIMFFIGGAIALAWSLGMI